MITDDKMQSTGNGYTIVKGDASNAELNQYLSCFERNGTVRDMQNLSWLHHKNLPGKNTIYYAMHNNDIAAIYTALPVLFRIDGRIVPALQSIDTLTDENHRGKGLFIKLANRLYSEEALNGFALVYGFPNDNSAPGFFKKLGWKSFGEAPFLIKPINPNYFFKKIINRKKHTDFSSTNHVFDAPKKKMLNNFSAIKEIEEFDSGYDVLWEAVSKNIRVSVDRSAAFMNWRYVHKPGEHYYRYGLYINNWLVAVVVFSIKHKHDGLVGYIMELVFDPAYLSHGKELLRFANDIFKQQKADVVLAWSIPGCFNFSAYKGSGYYTLPEKLRPQKLFVGARVFNDDLAKASNDFSNWYISYSDSDTA